MQKETSASIGKWSLDPQENVFVGEFNNVTDNAKAVFPGQKGGDSIYRVDKNPDAVYTPEAITESEYQFLYKGNGYFYGIKNDNTEVIAILTEDGKIIPTRQGIGGYNARTYFGGVQLCESGAMTDFEVTEKDGLKAVKVNYTASGENKAVLHNSSTYIFKEFCLDVEADFEMICEDCNRFGHINLTSKYINDSNSVARRLAMVWLYPENNDFVYKECDRFVISETYGDYVIHYAEHDPNSSHSYRIPGSAGDALPAFLKKTELGFEGKAQYSVSVTKNNVKEGYEGLFKTRNMEFAAGVSAIEETDNTTMFMGKNLRLNINVSNLSDNDIDFSVKYNIISYDNEYVASAIHYGNKLSAKAEANHNISIDNLKYGMYYLNLYVTTKDNEYRECYPFCMLEEFEYKHRAENRLGICAIHHETPGEADSTVSICNKMGLSIVRMGETCDRDRIKRLLKENNIRYVPGVGWNNTEKGIENWKETVRKCCKENPDAAYILMANEVDARTKANYGKAKKFLDETFVPYTFDPAYEVVSKEFPEMLDRIIWQSNCHGTVEWLEAYKECGIWDKSGLIDIHTYSSPSGPDKVFANSLYSMHANTFSNEYAMERWKRMTRRYGDKRMMVGETGYPTPAYCSDRKEIDIRTGADFNVRIAMFLFEAGCEDIIYYCLYDRTGALNGSSAWNEMYFGAVYNYDYNGVYMPKPWAAAFANLTRRMDGHKKVSFFDKYEENEFGTLRAFEVETTDNKFAVLWSNIYEQPNTSVNGRVDKQERIPLPAWESRWIETEIREFDAVGDTVTVVDVMGNSREIKAENGKVKIEVSGSPIYVYGIC